MTNPRPITTNMLVALCRLHFHSKVEEHEQPCTTLDALERRGLCVRVDMGEWIAYTISDGGKSAVDSYEKGIEAMRERLA